METILLTILPRLGLSVVGSFNNFFKILQFSQSVLERLASVCHLHCTVSRLRWRKERIHLKPGLALSERPVKYSLTWPLFNITNQIIILQKMMWWKASTLKKRIFLFLFFLVTVLTIYWLLWHWVLILWSTPVFFLQSSCVPYFLPFIQWLARNWHWFDRKKQIGINKREAGISLYCLSLPVEDWEYHKC